MKILRLTTLRSYLILSKNIKKSLLAINIGIFLSIFAATAAIISLYIEKQISEQEFILIENQLYEKTTKAIIEKVPAEVARIDVTLLGARERAQLYSLIRFTNFGKRIISENDLFLPYLYEYDLDTYQLHFGKDFQRINAHLEEVMKILEFGEYKKKKYKNLIKKYNEYKENLLTSEEALIVRKKLFHFSYSDLLKEINEDENNLYYEGDLRAKTNEALEFLNFIRAHTLMMEDITRGELYIYSEISLEAEENIIKYSNYEKKLIVFAFILQLIIFVIIQFFEISAVTPLKFKNKAKK